MDFPAVAKFYGPIQAPTTGDTYGRAISDFVSFCVWKPNRANMSYTFRSALIGTITMVPTTVRADSQTNHPQDPTNLLEAAKTYETIFIFGAEEEVLQPDLMIPHYEKIFSNLKVVRVPGAGHTVFWERPVETKKAIVEFVDRVTKA